MQPFEEVVAQHSPVVMRVSLRLSVLPQAGQVSPLHIRAVKSATVTNPVSPVQSAQRQ